MTRSAVILSKRAKQLTIKMNDEEKKLFSFYLNIQTDENKKNDSTIYLDTSFIQLI